jgi:hypothetical protein
MVIFDPPIYFKKPDENDDVLIFGKSPEQKFEDAKNGISRFGGTWRKPSYLHAYFRSADILLKQGNLENCLDDIGIPVFYIQRHTTELLIKMLLAWVYEIAELRTELRIDDCMSLSNGQQKRFKSSHNLNALLDDLSSSTKKFGFRELPSVLFELVRTISEFEKTETWSRYDKSETNCGKLTNHVQTEVALPLVGIQRHLASAISKICYKLEIEDSYENTLHDEWLNLARSAGRAG